MNHRLPLPPSNNALVRPLVLRGPDGRWTARLVSTGEAKAFRRAVHRLLPEAPVGGPLEVYLTVYVPTIASDGGNRLKALEDACNGRLWFDDKQIAEWHIRKVVSVDPEQVGVVLRVEPADPLEHPELSKRLARSSIADKVNERAQVKLDLDPPAAKPGKTFNAALREKLRAMAKPAVYPP